MPKLRVDPTRESVLGLYQLGRMPPQIAEELAISPILVSRYLGALRNARILPKAKDDPQMKAWICERVLAGKTKTAIARDVGLNPSYIDDLVFCLRSSGDLPSIEPPDEEEAEPEAEEVLTAEQERMVRSLRERGESEKSALLGMRSWYRAKARREFNRTSRDARAA